MKIIVAIWMASVLIMGTSLYPGHVHLPEVAQEADSHHCCHHGEDPVDGQQEDDRRNGHDQEDGHECYPGCGCGCFQITVFDFQFMILPGIPVQHHDYGDYINIYHFELSSPLFEPPRLG